MSVRKAMDTLDPPYQELLTFGNTTEIWMSAKIWRIELLIKIHEKWSHHIIMISVPAFITTFCLNTHITLNFHLLLAEICFIFWLYLQFFWPQRCVFDYEWGWKFSVKDLADWCTMCSFPVKIQERFFSAISG